MAVHLILLLPYQVHRKGVYVAVENRQYVHLVRERHPPPPPSGPFLLLIRAHYHASNLEGNTAMHVHSSSSINEYTRHPIPGAKLRKRAKASVGVSERV